MSTASGGQFGLSSGGAGFRDLVYPQAVIAGRIAFGAMGLRFDVHGVENLPRSGGGVVASNHVSYLDFALLARAAAPSGRYIRFMAKESVFRHRVSGPLMRSMHHISVDRAAGTASYREALRYLKDGELVGVFPEATISRSFQLKEFKPGAVRMAQGAGVPVIPAIVWGGQRIYSKGTPRDFTGRGKTISVVFGEPMPVAKGVKGDVANAELFDRLSAMLGKVQLEYPDRPSGPEDRWWLPTTMGGSAPSPEQAAELDRKRPES